MLDGGQARLQVYLPIIVNQADRAGHGTIAGFAGKFHEAIAGERGDGMRAALIAALPGDHGIELREQAFGQGDTETNDFIGFMLRAGHGKTCGRPARYGRAKESGFSARKVYQTIGKA